MGGSGLSMVALRSLMMLLGGTVERHGEESRGFAIIR